MPENKVIESGNALISALRDQLGADKVLTGADLEDKYYHIWKMNDGLNALAYTLPSTTEDVSVILKSCNAHDVPVIVFGGLTNLVGSTEPQGNEVIISMQNLNKIIETDTGSRTMTVEAGVVLERIQQEAKNNKLLFPLNFGAKGTAQIGGIISTNAGGLRVFRYGMTRQLILGLETVLMDGTIISGLKKIIKDNSAYDLKHLFIGSEGTLGVITKAVLKLIEPPQSRCSAFVGINSYENVIALLKHLDKGSAGALSGYELIWGNTYRAMTSPPAHSKPPLPHGYSFYVLMEIMGSNQEKDNELLSHLLEQALEKEIIEDATLAHTQSDLEWFWKIREDVHALVVQCNYDQHFDISIPISDIGDAVSKMSQELEKIEGVEKIFPFGHVADGNVHFIIGKVSEDTSLKNKINDVIYSPIKALGGSVSAEHGIGLHKKQYLALCRTPEEIETMKKLKRTLDPKLLLNPHKILDI